jgi:APA family basic amino acid/polyamine antiporter
MVALTIANASVCRLRYSEPDRDRPFKVPLAISVGGGELPLPSVLGAVLSAGGWIVVMVLHAPARWVGLGWMAFGLVIYVAYRKRSEIPLLRRVTVSPQMLSAEQAPERDYGSILVPLFGTELDEDIVQTAALLASGVPTDEAAIDPSTIEALWVFEIPMSLPLEARLPEAQVAHARQALARAKVVGEEYAGVQVATATVRARRAGHAIVAEASRRGVEAIVLGTEEPSRVRGGGRLGGIGGPYEQFVGEATKYVVARAPCRVILTAPPARERPAAQ